jgi:hypothetical protein
VMKTVEEDGLKLEFLDEIFRNDIDVVLAAIQENPYALEYASLDCRNNPLVVIPALEADYDVYKYVGRDFKIDRNTALNLVKEDGLRLEYLIYAYKDDEEIVRLAIQQNPVALSLASPRLKKDVDFVLDNIRGQEWAIENADSSIVNDTRVKNAIDDEILRPLHEEYQDHIEAVKNAWLEALDDEFEMRAFFDELEFESKLEELDIVYSDEILADEDFDEDEFEEHVENETVDYDWRDNFTETICKHFCELPMDLRSDGEIRAAVFELVGDCRC